MPDDAELLHRYLRHRSDAAFAELVRRHIDFVYSAALRKLNGDAHRAKDVTQAVFIQLATHPLPPRDRHLAGWLYTAAHHLACKAVRTEVRRRRREQEAQAMHEINAARQPEWERIRPVLDDAIQDLARTDREAVVLRFFERRAFADIGARLGLTEDAARMRVDRALDKLHGALARRGIRSATGVLAALLAEQAVASAPQAVVAGVTDAALAAGASATLTVVSLMSTAKSLSLAGLIGVSLTANLLLVAGLTDRGAAAIQAATGRVAGWFGHGRAADRPGKSSAGAKPRTTGVAAASATAPAAATHASPGASAADASTTFQRLFSDDPATFAANLLAAGFSSGATRGGVVALLRNHDSRARAALFKASPPPPYWNTTASTAPTADQLAGFAQTQSERSRIMRELFPEERDKEFTALRALYGPLSDDKLAAIEALDNTYRLMRQQMTAGRGSGAQLTLDREELAQQDAARQQALRSLLAPAEYEDYTFRTSPIAADIRQLPAFNPTEAEFRALFALKSELAERTRLTANALSPVEQMQAQQALNAQVAAALGPQRFAEYERASDPIYQDAYAIVQQLNLPPANAAAVRDAQKDLLARAAAIRTNRSQTPDQQAARLQELAASADEQLGALLTPRGLETYKRTSGVWLRSLTRTR